MLYESIVVGIMCGELLFFSEMNRMVMCVVESEGGVVVWVMDWEGWGRM